MAAGDLITLDALKGWMQLPPDTDDGLLGDLIASASAQLQAWLGYQVTRATYTRTFNGRGTDRMFVPDWPLTAVASLQIDGVTIPAAVGATGSGYVFDGKAIYLRGYSFARGVQNVAITYTAGYAPGAFPAQFEQACLDLTTTLYANRDRDPGVISRRAGDTAEVYGGNVTQFSGTTIPLPLSVVAALQPFRRMVTA